ncbi:MAG TPA: glycosyltransferase family A protein [Actinomycetota bacterium]
MSARAPGGTPTRARVPELTVVIPTKDRPAVLPRALGSVLEQVHDVEVIVIDDGSSPENAAAIAAICAEDHRIRLIRNETAQGAPHGRNRGLAEARGRFWATLDDDDVWLPGKWVAQRAVLEGLGFPDDVVVVMGITEAGRTVPADLSPTVRAPERPEGLAALMRAVPPAAFLNTYVVPTAMMRAAGGYDDRLVWGEHTDVLIRLAARARFAGAAGAGVMVDRGHADGGGRVGRDWTRKVAGVGLLLSKHAEAFAREPALRATYRHVLGVSQLRAGDRWGATGTFLRVAAVGPGAARRARALAHFVLAVIGGRSLWRRVARMNGAPAEVVS